MPMPSSEIARLIKQGIPDAKVEITDLAGDGSPAGGSIVCTNGPLHAEVLGMLTPR